MTPLDALLVDLAARGVTVAAEAGQLKIQAPKGALTPALRDALATHKPALLARLAGDGRIPRVPREGPLALSWAQERLWFLDRLAPGDPAYHVPAALRLVGVLDLAAVRTAMNGAVAAHEALRTRFVAPEGRPGQLIDPPGPAEVTVHAMAGELQAAIAAEIRRPFDLAAGWPWRATLLNLGPQEHVLVLVFHHVIADAWSCGLLAAELAARYRAAAAGEPQPVALAAVQPADHAAWQRARAGSPAAEAALAERRARLTGAPALELPADLRLNEGPTADAAGMAARPGRRVERPLPAALARDLATYAARVGATPFMVLLAAYAALLGRHADQDDFLLGVPVAGRDRRDLEGAVGCFVNALVLRLDLAGRPSFDALVTRVRDESLAAQAAADVPFERLVEALRPVRALGRTPLFQAAFVMQPGVLPPLDTPGLTVRPVPIDTGTAKFDLTLDAIPGPDGAWTLAWEAAADCFSATTVAAWAARFERLLAGALAAPEAPVAAVPLMDAAEQATTLALGAPRAAFPGDVTPIARFRDHALKTPDAIALVDGSARWTYARLAAEVETAAQALRARGVGPEVRVGVCMARSARLVVAILAIQRAGGAYVPMDPDYPAARLAFLAADAGLTLTLTDDDAWEAAPSQALAGPDPDDLAYIIYTSGSTGAPKGVEVTQRNVARLLDAAGSFAFGPTDVWTLFHACAFDFSVWELWGALAFGGRLVVVPTLVARDPVAFARLLQDEHVTVLNQTPSAFRRLAEVLKPGALRWVIFGGEGLDVRALAPWFARVGTQGPGLVNMYGITETTVHVTERLITPADLDGPASPKSEAQRAYGSIGRPLADLGVYLLDALGQPVPAGVPGEIHVSGPGVARGYHQRPALDAARFLANPFGPGRLYRSGDRARWLPSGELAFLGRVDEQLKVRGYRVEPGEVEAALQAHPAVARAAVVGRDDRLLAYVVADEDPALPAMLRAWVGERLPAHMVPAVVTILPDLPLTPHGKLDRRALPEPAADRPALATPFLPPRTALEVAIAAAWAEVLGVDRVGIHDGFFDLGGHSLLLPPLASRLGAIAGRDVPLVAFFQHPTVAALATYLAGDAAVPTVPVAPKRADDGGIAIVGMAGRFPGADSVEAFWDLLVEGREGLTRLDDAALRAAGVSEADLADPRYVKAAGILADVDRFDAAFFGFAPREAEVLDPQQRLFLETAWQALEHAGHPPGPRAGGPDDAPVVGVFAGAGLSRYLLFHLAGRPDIVARTGELPLLLANDKDYVPARAAYALDARGPVMAIQTGCSTSLVAVCEAVSALRSGSCDLALAGGVAIETRQGLGYRWQPGGIGSPDGRCRAFDAQAAGTVGGSGVAVVALRRLADAVADGDTIWAVIRGAAVASDGADKVGFTAPSVAGQTKAIRAALAEAGVVDVGYVEAHGTGTALGDPIEVTALNAAYRGATGVIGLGSLKTNVGHLDAAAGVAGLIKAALMLARRTRVASLHYTAASPAVPFADGPFQVVTEGGPWAGPLRAGVSSFGLGGTNAHVVLEAWEPATAQVSGEPQVLLLSAKSALGLAAAAEALAGALAGTHVQPVSLPDVAHTLRVGRAVFPHRLAIVARTAEEAARKLRAASGAEIRAAARPLFLIPGLGVQRPGMARELYDREPAYRAAIDRGAEHLVSLGGADLRPWLLAEPDDADAAAALLRPTHMQPAIALSAWAAAQLWAAWGVRPAAIAAHSLGEWVAAAIAGVMDPLDMLALVAERGRLFELATGATLLVAAEATDLAGDLDDVHVAAQNGPGLIAVAGTAGAIARLQLRLTQQGIGARLLAVPHAVHVPLVAGLVAPLVAAVAKVRLQPPQLPFLSGPTGKWITPEDACDPAYWGQQLAAPVLFGAGLAQALADPAALIVELVPGLGAIARRAGRPGLATSGADTPGEAFAAARAALWTAGQAFDHRASRGRRIPIPGTQFAATRFWIPAATLPASPQRPGPAPSLTANQQQAEPAPLSKANQQQAEPAPLNKANQQQAGPTSVAGASLAALGLAPSATLLHVPTWTRLPASPATPVAPGPWLVLGAGDALVTVLRAAGATAAGLSANPDPAALAERLATLAPREVVLILPPDPDGAAETGFWLPFHLARAWTAPGRLTLVAGPIHDVTGGEDLDAGAALALGPARCLPFEGRDVRVIDAAAGTDVLSELQGTEPLVALRGGHRWVPGWAQAAEQPHRDLTDQIWLVTGGLGGVGLALAEALAGAGVRGMALIGRRPALVVVPGAETLVLQADVADEAAIALAMATTRQHFGRLDGVLHAAGVPSGGLIATRDPAAAAEVLRAKVLGTRVLVKAIAALSERPALIAIGALTAVTGGPGQADYTAANAFLTATTTRLKAAGWDAQTFAWAPWLGVGMAAHPVPAGLGAWAAARDAAALGRAEAQAALLAALSINAAEVAIAPVDPQAIVAALRQALASHPLLSPSSPVGRAERTYPRPAIETAYTAPRDPEEAALAALWADVLGLDAVGIHDGFFDLGGHSLLGLTLAARLEAHLGRPVPLATLVRAGTVAGLAEALGQPPDTAVPLNAAALNRSPGPAVFLIPGAGGLAYPLRPLAAELPHPTWALESPGLQGDDPVTDVEAAAARHADALAATRPTGPVILAGWSAGALVAHALAARLQAAGRAVDRLVIIDMPAPVGPPADPPPDDLLLARFVHELTASAGLPPILDADPASALPRAIAAARAAGALPADLPDAQVNALWQVFRASAQATAGYRPAPNQTPVTLVQAANGPFATEPEPDWGWRHLGPLESITSLEADHHSILAHPDLPGLISGSGL